MSENTGWVGKVEEDCLHPTLFQGDPFTNIGRSAGSEGYYARNKSPYSMGFTLSLGGRNNDFHL